MSQGDSPRVALDLGTEEVGIRFEWKQLDPYITAYGQLTVHIWDGLDDEAAGITLASEGALELAQWINERLGRD